MRQDKPGTSGKEEINSLKFVVVIRTKIPGVQGECPPPLNKSGTHFYGMTFRITNKVGQTSQGIRGEERTANKPEMDYGSLSGTYYR